MRSNADSLLAEVHEAPSGEVQAALADILKSVHFRASKQSQHLLRYIVEQTLAGHADLLKERVVGAEVFGRAIDYDTNADPIVRARAAEVRKRLAQYYVGEGHESSVRIEISPGSYLATISVHAHSRHHNNEPHTAQEPPVQPVITRPASPAPRPPRFSPRLLVLACVILLAASVVYISWPTDPVQQFWAPLLHSSRPVLIYTGANPVYMPSSESIERFKSTHSVGELDSKGREFLIPVTGDQSLDIRDLVEIRNEFVTIGDAAANVSVAALLTGFHHGYDLRSGQDVAFGDLREAPTVLIGAFNNSWTLQMTGDLPFVFASGLTIRDVANKKREWHPSRDSEGRITTDYAIVARLPRSHTGASLVAIAGITQSGTRAAAEFISSPSLLRELLAQAPASWADANMEFVLETRVVNDIPTTPRVVALRTW